MQSKFKTVSNFNIVRHVLRFTEILYLHELVYKFLRHNNKLITEILADHTIIYDPSEYIGHHLFKYGHYQRPVIDSAIKTSCEIMELRNSSIFLEVGANIGTQTVYANISDKFDSFICIEPDERNVELLRLNVLINRFAERVTIHNCAAGSDDGVKILYRNYRNWGNSSLISSAVHANKPDESAAVSVRIIDDLMEACGVDIANIGMIWMDVEGYELNAMKGMKNILKFGAPFVFEYSADKILSGERAELEAVIFSNYNRFFLFKDEFVEISRDDFQQMSAHCDVLVINDPARVP